MRTYVIQDSTTELFWDSFECQWQSDSECATHYTNRQDALDYMVKIDTQNILGIFHVNNRRAQIGVGHVPRGSVVEIKVGSVHPEPIVRTVMDIRANGCNSWVIETEVASPVLGMKETYNISHITRVIKRGTGSCAVAKQLLGLDRVFSRLFALKYKHPSQYGSYSMNEVIWYLADSMATDAQLVDHQKLTGLVLSNPACKYANESKWDRHHMGRKINKKKLRRLIKRFLPQCLIRRAAAQREYNREMERMYEEDFDNDYRQGRGDIDLGEPGDVESNDDWENDQYRDDIFGDQDLPKEFLTNFNLNLLPVYRAAVERSGIIGFEVHDTDDRGGTSMGSLWFYGELDPDVGLTEFWRLFGAVRIEFQQAKEQELAVG